MDDKTTNTSEQTEERLRLFHEQSERQPKEPVSCDRILAFCAWIIAVGGMIGSFFAFKGIECAIYVFLPFTAGVFLYTIARIYTTLREMRDNLD